MSDESKFHGRLNIISHLMVEVEEEDEMPDNFAIRLLGPDGFQRQIGTMYIDSDEGFAGEVELYKVVAYIGEDVHSHFWMNEEPTMQVLVQKITEWVLEELRASECDTAAGVISAFNLRWEAVK